MRIINSVFGSLLVAGSFALSSLLSAMSLILSDSSSLSYLLLQEDKAVLPPPAPPSSTVAFSLPNNIRNIDIGVPFSGRPETLDRFAAILGDTVQEFRKIRNADQVNIRLFVTRYEADDSSEEKRDELFQLSRVDKVVFVPVSSGESFSRARALNAIHDFACGEDDNFKFLKKNGCVMAAIDVDMKLSEGFLVNAMQYADSKQAVYFPTVFSEYRPSMIQLTEALKGHVEPFSSDHGWWRPAGYGMYVINGVDRDRLRFNESFVGWGGEDVSFFHDVVLNRNYITRVREKGLVHLWHPKYCILGETVASEEKLVNW
jgi:chondroitin sulfate synthase